MKKNFRQKKAASLVGGKMQLIIVGSQQRIAWGETVRDLAVIPIQVSMSGEIAAVKRITNLGLMKNKM